LFFWILFWFKICKLISRSVENENGEGSSFENEDSSVQLSQDAGGTGQPRGEKSKLVTELARLGGEDVCYWANDPDGKKRKAFNRMTVATLRYRVAEFDNDDRPVAKRPRIADGNDNESGCV
jgi:hypothetical protein